MREIQSMDSFGDILRSSRPNFIPIKSFWIFSWISLKILISRTAIYHTYHCKIIQTFRHFFRLNAPSSDQLRGQLNNWGSSSVLFEFPKLRDFPNFYKYHLFFISNNEMQFYLSLYYSINCLPNFTLSFRLHFHFHYLIQCIMINLLFVVLNLCHEILKFRII